jgi:hypothetical protein
MDVTARLARSAHSAIALAKAHLGKGSASHAEAALRTAEYELCTQRYILAIKHAVDSLRHSIGVLHQDFVGLDQRLEVSR